MAYRIEETKTGKDLIIDGWESGIADSPYTGIANTRNLNNTYYPGVAYSNYKRQAVTTSGIWFAGTHSTNVSNNTGWIFAASGSGSLFTNPLHKAVSPAGLIYVLDDSGHIWKQSAVNSSTFNLLGDGTGRLGTGSKGLAYWNNYLVVFGDELTEFCGNGSDDSGIVASNWNIKTTNGVISYTVIASTSPSELDSTTTIRNLYVNDSVVFTTTGNLPSPLQQNTTYYIKSVTTSVIQVSATVGGSTIVFTNTGSGTHTITSTVNKLPLGNVTDMTFTSSSLITADSTSATISSYTTPQGTTATGEWQGATGNYNLIAPSGDEILALFTRGSATVTFQPIQYDESGTFTVNIINPDAPTNKTYVSKVDGNLYYANGRSLGRILSQNVTTVFNPSAENTYNVDYTATALLQPDDEVVDMTDLQSTLMIAGNKDLYPWGYVSATPGPSSPVGEQIVGIENILNNIYVTAGQKGNIYIFNGFSAQLFFKIPDYIAGVIDPVWSFGANMVHRSKLYFQVLAQNNAGTNILAGIFSLIVSPKDGQPVSLVQETQNSYGLTPSSGALSTGVLIDNSPSSTGYDSYYSGWSNGATTGGIDYNNTTLWDNFEPTIETDIVPIGTILDKTTFGNIEFKLDRPMVSGDQIRMYWRPSLTDNYTLMGTTTTTQLSDYYPSNISQAQWAQFKVQMKCASSSSSFVPLREIRLHSQSQ